MSEITPPEDVAALLSHTNLNSYKVFTQERRNSGNGATSLSSAGIAPARGEPATPEPVTLEFVRPQPARWSLLQDMGPDGDSPALRESHELLIPTFAVCSTGGGTGKTTVSATLGRALALTGDNVLMVQGALQPSAPLHFGAQHAQPGRLRTFVPPVRSQGTVHMLGHQFDDGNPQNEESGTWLTREVNALQNEIHRCIVEISSSTGPEAPMLNLARVCLIVVTPDINSVMALTPFRKLFERTSRPGARHQQNVHFLINKFDPASNFHAEVRQNLRMQLGTRLLPFCIRRSDSVSEALAAGMTVLDYAPNSAPADDFLRLAAWARDVASSQRAQGAI